MAQTEDKDIFAWMDRLNHKEMNGVEEIDPYDGEEVDEAAWQRIRKRTFAQLECDKEAAGPQKKAKLDRKALHRKWLVAASAVIIMITTFISISPDARAELKKVLQFIPGFGFVQPNADSEEGAYILPKPIESIGDYGKITVEGVLIQSSIGHISLEGDNVSATTVKSLKSLTLVTEQGQFEFKRGSAVWAGGGPWQAGFYYEGNIPYDGLDEATLKFGNTSIGPLHLTKAETADDIADFGSSDIRNGIQITGVVTPLDGNVRKVNLLTQLSGEQKVDSYGKKSIAEGLQLQLTDQQGRALPIEKGNGFSKPRELSFDAPTGSVDFKLVIPAIRIVDPGAKHVKVTLPVPEEGTKEIRVSSQIAGFPVEFTRVERLSDEILRIDVDTHFDYDQQRTLQNYRIFTKNGSFMSYSSQVNERTRAVETEWLSIEPGQKEVTFYIGEPHIVVKGPWVLNDLQ